MTDQLRGAFFDRNALPEIITNAFHPALEVVTWESFAHGIIPARGAGVGTWSLNIGDPLIEFFVVRDEDYADTLTWLNAYFSGLSPVSQWCRVLTQSQAVRIANRSKPPSLDNMLSAWTGAILAECSGQAGGLQNLRDLPGSATLSSASFAAGRSSAVWGDKSELAEIGRRHDDLSYHLRDGARPIGAESLIPLWSILNGNLSNTPRSDRKTLEPLASIVSGMARQQSENDTAGVVSRTASQASRFFDTPELIDCADGPQIERVKALDRLGERLSTGPRSPVVDALLGLGASFIDPGASVSPELLRRHEKQLPTAAVWQGAFAGLIAPLRVMVDQSGLGRLISKALCAPDDLRGRPACDISYDELIRWVTPGRPLKVDMRGMSTRVLMVELVTGVTCAFAYGRSEVGVSPAIRSDTSRSSSSERSRTQATRISQDLESLVINLRQRVERLESQQVTPQKFLDFGDERETKNNRSNRSFSKKKD